MSTISIQPSFREVIADVQAGTLPEDTFWINIIAYDDLDNGEAREETMAVYKSGEELLFSNKNGLEFEVISKTQYRLTLGGQIYNLKAPLSSVKTNVAETTAFDISPQEDTYIIGTDHGSFTIGSLVFPEKDQLEVKEAHYSTVLKAVFFPSGKVALTAGLDYQIKIWDVTDGSSPREFAGHKERITDLAMIDRGRNFLSSSTDGTVKLWDCASGNHITSLSRAQSLKDGVTTLCITQAETEMVKTKSSYEAGTLGKNVYAGHESGVISVFDLGSREELSSIPSLRSPVVSIGNLGGSRETLYATYDAGVIAQWDLRNTKEPVVKRDFGSNMNAMTCGESDIAVSYNSGYTISLSRDSLETLFILSGSQDDCNLLTSSSKHTYLTSSVGNIYKY